jgi:hypothetical protein
MNRCDVKDYFYSSLSLLRQQDFVALNYRSNY